MLATFLRFTHQGDGGDPQSRGDQELWTGRGSPRPRDNMVARVTVRTPGSNPAVYTVSQPCVSPTPGCSGPRPGVQSSEGCGHLAPLDFTQGELLQTLLFLISVE